MKIAKILFSCLALALSLNLFAEPVQETMPEETVQVEQVEIADTTEQDQCLMEHNTLFSALSGDLNRNRGESDECVNMNVEGMDLDENAAISAFACQESGVAFVMSVFDEGCTQMGLFIGRGEDMGWTLEDSNFSEEQSLVVRSQLNCVEASLFLFSSNQDILVELAGADHQEMQNALAGEDAQASLQELSDKLCVD